MKNQMFFGRPGETVYGGVDFGLHRESVGLVPSERHKMIVNDPRLRSNISDMIHEKVEKLGSLMSDQLDEIIEKELRVFLGLGESDFLDLQALVGRCQRYKFPPSKNDFLYIDGKPFLEIEPIESGTEKSGSGHFLTFNRKYKRLF